MTHCVACDRNLTDFESTRKLEQEDGKFIYPDLCNKCFSLSGVGELSSVVIRSDLQHEEDINDFDDGSEIADKWNNFVENGYEDGEDEE